MSNAIPENIFLPCGGMAFFDVNSGISYRCEDCGAVVGSIGMNKECYNQIKKYDMWKELSGRGWDYLTGKLEG